MYSNNSGEIQKLETLQLKGTGIPIEVRVIRRWTPYLRPNDRCYILLDVEGYAVQAVAHGQRDIRHVEKNLDLLSCYRINGYVCTAVDTYMNVMTHPIHLLIGTAAVMTKIPEPEGFPMHYFQPRVYADLRQIYDRKEGLIDYIGVMEKKEFVPTKTPHPMLQLTVANSSGRTISVSLWKEVNQFPERVNMEELNNIDGPALIAVSSVRIKDYRGRLQLHSTAATYLYVKPASPTISLLLDRIKEREDELENEHGEGTLVAVDISSKISIAELQQTEKDLLIGRAFTVEGSVTEIHSTTGWYYNACPKCPKAANESGPEWACASDGRFPAPRPAYRVQATIADNTGAMKVTFFDEGAESLVGKPCSELVIESGYTDQSIVPDPLQEIKGKPKAFHLEMQTNARPGRLNMTVSAVEEIDITLPLSIEAAPLTIDAAPALQLKPEETAPPQPRSSSIAPVTPVKIKFEPRAAEKDGPKRSLKTEKGPDESRPKRGK
ncbi:hypothetical protein SSX86_028614 [Deinandra increscens subsp. villosa]|uniref:Replication factor A C-terminal domain-containing protein n=1 Tax=Deinandra increscens subsp. villosa TaxID=3103831 RepID=A0AAP0C8D7_9ASTR